MMKAPARPVTCLALLAAVLFASDSSHGEPVIKYVVPGTSRPTQQAQRRATVEPTTPNGEETPSTNETGIVRAALLPAKTVERDNPGKSVTAETLPNRPAARLLAKEIVSPTQKRPTTTNGARAASEEVRAASELIPTHWQSKPNSAIALLLAIPKETSLTPQRIVVQKVAAPSTASPESTVAHQRVESTQNLLLEKEVADTPDEARSQLPSPKTALTVLADEAVLRTQVRLVPVPVSALRSQQSAAPTGSQELANSMPQDNSTESIATESTTAQSTTAQSTTAQSIGRTQIQLVPAPLLSLRRIQPPAFAAPQDDAVPQEDTAPQEDDHPKKARRPAESIARTQVRLAPAPLSPLRRLQPPAPVIDLVEEETELTGVAAPQMLTFDASESSTQLAPAVPSASIVRHAAVQPTPESETMNSELVEKIVGRPSLIAFVSDQPEVLPRPGDAEPIDGDSTDAADDTDDADYAVGLRPIDRVTINVRPPEGELPPDHASARFSKDGELVQRMGASRHWMMFEVNWDAASLATRPLYFEDVNLERYGFSHGILFDPIYSAAHFFVRVPFIPYMRGATPPRRPVYTLGYGRPGTYFPYYLHRPPLSVRGGLQQAVTAVGLVYLLP